MQIIVNTLDDIVGELLLGKTTAYHHADESGVVVDGAVGHRRWFDICLVGRIVEEIGGELLLEVGVVACMGIENQNEANQEKKDGK